MNERAQKALGVALICGVVWVIAVVFLDGYVAVWTGGPAAMIGLVALAVAGYRLIRS